jgi:hypothetical protein
MISRRIADVDSLQTTGKTDAIRKLGSGAAVVNLLIKVSWDCFQIGKFDHAEQLLLQALRLRETSLGTTHRRLMPILNSMGQLYAAQDRLVEAESSYLRGLEIACLKQRYPTYEIDLMQNYEQLLAKMNRIEEAHMVADCLKEAKDKQRVTGLLHLTRNLSTSRNVSSIRRVYGTHLGAPSRKLILQRIVVVLGFGIICLILLMMLQHN